MPSNQKNFCGIKRAKFDSFRQALREQGWIPPYSDSGFLRGGDGLLVDLNYNEATEQIDLRARDVGKGRTFSSFFDKVETILKGITA